MQTMIASGIFQRVTPKPRRGRPIKYTREAVAAHVATSKSWYELALALGLGWESTPATQPVVRAVVGKLGVEVRFPRKPRGVDYPAVPRPVPVAVPKKVPLVRVTRELLEPHILAGKTQKQIALDLGKRTNTVHAALLRFGLKIQVPAKAPLYPREVLEPLVQAHTNYHGVARSLGFADPGRWGRIREAVSDLGLDVSHFTRKPRSKQKPRTRPSGNLGKGMPWQQVLVLHPVGTDTHGGKLLRALLWSGRPYLCEVCGNPPKWNGQDLRLQVDHISGDGWDDRPENLRIICPNCHTQTGTFCGRNLSRRRGKASPRANYEASIEAILKARDPALVQVPTPRSCPWGCVGAPQVSP